MRDRYPVVMRARDLSLPAGLYLTLVLALGGAGAGYPLLEGAEEVGALTLIAACVGRRDAAPSRIGRMMVGLWVFCLAVVVVQLVPLPPAMWTMLPDRELAARIGRLAGQSTLWRPISLMPERTVQALLALFPPGAMLVAALRLPVAARWRLVAIVVGFALLGVALGAVQLASGTGDGVTPFATQHRGDAIGLFVNRNHQATFLLVAMILGGALGARAARRSGWRVRLPALAGTALLALGVVATTSRAGTALLAPALLVTVPMLFAGRLTWRGGAAGAIVTAAAMLAAWQTATVQHTVARFGSIEDERAFFRQDTLAAIDRSFPAGTGLGGFEPAHHAVEPLGHVGADVPNHAHDDYLELVMDAGVAAMVGIAGLAVVLVAAGRRLARRRPESDERLLGIAGLSGIAIMLLHSIVDYPLRMTAIAVLFALCAALAAPPPRSAEGDGAGSIGRTRATALALGLALAGALVVADAASLHLAQQGRQAAAQRWAPWGSSPTSALATAAILSGRPAAAAVYARAALARAPTDAAAVRSLGLSEEAAGHRAAASVLMDAAGALGWRDRLAQYWLMERSFERGDAASAVARTDALLRQDTLTGPLFAMLHQAMRDGAVRTAVADRLAAQPAWGEDFLRDTGALGIHRLADHERLLAIIARRSPALARKGVARVADRLVALGDVDRAARLWSVVAGRATLRDGGFTSVGDDGANGPFGWTLAEPVATRVAVEVPDTASDGAALHVRSGGVATGIVARQLVTLPPGRSILHFVSLSAIPAAGPWVEWRIACHGGGVATTGTAAGGPATARWTRRSLPIDLPRSGCPHQELQLWSTATSPSDVWIRRVTIDPR